MDSSIEEIWTSFCCFCSSSFFHIFIFTSHLLQFTSVLNLAQVLVIVAVCGVSLPWSLSWGKQMQGLVGRALTLLNCPKCRDLVLCVWKIIVCIPLTCDECVIITLSETKFEPTLNSVLFLSVTSIFQSNLRTACVNISYSFQLIIL